MKRAMNRTQIFPLLLVLGTVACVVPACMRSTSAPMAQTDNAGSAARSESTGGCGECGCDVATLPVPSEGALTAAEREALIGLWSEEKLAFDVYTELSKTYPMRMYDNIAAAESRHRAAIAALAERYDLADASEASLAPGAFHDEAITNLYDTLVERGQSSRLEAMRVGCLIEELDIADLRAAAAQTDRQDLKTVYANLERGSENHLRAFSRQLDRLGGTYTPEHLSDEDFNDILAGSNR